MLIDSLRAIRTAFDTTDLFAALGYAPERQPFDDTAWVVARWKGFKVVATEAAEPVAAVRGLARTLAASSTRALAVAVGPARSIALAAPNLGRRGISPVWDVNLLEPPSHVLDHLESFRPKSTANGLAHALRVTELLSTEPAGERFYQAFRAALERMAADLPADPEGSDGRLVALLTLTRVLFLYFVQAKGWLDHRLDYLRAHLDACLVARRPFHRSVLDPLFFEVLNRPLSSRRRVARLGSIPYLNGGLFGRHPSERRLAPVAFSNALWRDVFDDLFERFRFCVREADEVDVIAPDMLGRVFERVMEPEQRQTTGTFYTPRGLVRQIVEATLETALLDRGLPPGIVRNLAAGHAVPERWWRRSRTVLSRLRVLDPAVGSGAFLLGALEALTAAQRAVRCRTPGPRSADLRRRILRDNLFGVDRNPLAVRLAELRLWLAVIADDPTTDIATVEPLPNLDGVVRQGDSLVDPIGAAMPWAGSTSAATGALRRNVREAERILFTARGRSRAPAIDRLRRRERTLAEHLLTHAGRRITYHLRDLDALARGKDLFGIARGLTPDERHEYRALQRRHRDLHEAMGAVRDGEVPFFSFEVHAPTVMAGGGFHVVLGNPPWVRAERLPPALRDVLKQRFAWWQASGTRGFRHQPDLAVAFLERALGLCAPGGAIGLLLPSKVTTADYGRAARGHLVRETTLHYIHRVPPKQAASFGATTYPVALIARNDPPAPGHTTRLGFAAPDGVTQQRLGEDGPWILASDRVGQAIERLRASGTALGSVAPPALGVKTGADGVMVGTLIERHGATCVVRFGAETHEVESEVLRPVVRGRDVVAFGATPQRVVIWAYGDDGRPRRNIPPLIGAYLRHHRDRLTVRRDHRGGPVWTLYRTRAALGAHRVVWRDIARRPAAVALDFTPVPCALPLNTCYVACTPGSDMALLVAAVFNSTWAHALALAGADEARGGYRRVNARATTGFPIPTPTAAHDAIRLSLRRHQGATDDPDELDGAVASALRLDADTQRTLRGYVRDYG